MGEAGLCLTVVRRNADRIGVSFSIRCVLGGVPKSLDATPSNSHSTDGAYAHQTNQRGGTQLVAAQTDCGQRTTGVSSGYGFLAAVRLRNVLVRWWVTVRPTTHAVLSSLC